jgi:putative transposase
LRQAVARFDMRLLAYCLMPNHFHLLLWPREDGDLSTFMRWLTTTHTQRWHAHDRTARSGHLYQGRYKSFPVQSGEHLLTVCRYVERNAPRANLIQRAEEWK